jgi:PAS domain S-box-containing protein
MRQIFRDMPIRRKLRLIIMVTSVTVLLLSSMAFMINEVITFWKVEKGKLSALADIIGNNTSAAIAFNDQKAAEQTLSGLNANPYILAAYIVARDDEVFAQYLGKEEKNKPSQGLKTHTDLIREANDSFFEDRDFDLEVAKPILLDNQMIGTVVIQSTFGELTSRMKSLLSVVALIMVGTFFVAYVLSTRLQHIISGPLLRLTQTMRTVSEGKDYSIREKKESNDELGILIDGFNEMLTQIEERDKENIIKAEIGRIISSTLDIEQVYDRFASAVRRLIHFDRISISIIDWERGVSRIAYAMGIEIADRRPGDVFPIIGSHYEDNEQARSSVFVQAEDIREIAEQHPSFLSTFQAGLRSMISVPLISKDQVIGGLHLRCIKLNAYTERDLKIAENIGIQIAGAIANAQLFQERRRAEEALRQSEEKYRTILENIEDGYYEVDLAGNITFFNDSICRISGRTKEELMGMNNLEYTDPENAKKLFQTFNQVYRTGEPRRALDWEIIRKDGTKRCMEASISLQKDSSGNPIGFRGIVRDITERKRAEEVLKEKTEELARSNKDLEQFAYVASHDLQEPLRMVTNYVQLLARRYQGKLDSDADEFIGFAVDGAVRMWKLINDLLTYSRVGMRGKELEPIDCETVLNQSLNNLKMAIEEKGAVVTHDPLPTVMADNPQLELLFQNLIGNAIKFQGNEPSRIHVSASRNGSGWTFSVRDNGIGIAPEYAERIFIIFQRLHRRKEYPGTGIGLAICKKIVERHGGYIWVESEVGKGATFYFTLPASKEKLLSHQVSKEGSELRKSL